MTTTHSTMLQYRKAYPELQNSECSDASLKYNRMRLEAAIVHKAIRKANFRGTDVLRILYSRGCWFQPKCRKGPLDQAWGKRDHSQYVAPGSTALGTNQAGPRAVSSASLTAVHWPLAGCCTRYSTRRRCHPPARRHRMCPRSHTEMGQTAPEYSPRPLRPQTLAYIVGQC